MNKGLSYLEDLEYITRMYTALMEMKYVDDEEELGQEQESNASSYPDPEKQSRSPALTVLMKGGGLHV